MLKVTPFPLLSPRLFWEIDTLVTHVTRARCEERGIAIPILKCKIERDDVDDTPGISYVVTFGYGRGRWRERVFQHIRISLDVTVYTCDHQPDLKLWLRRVRLVYSNKNDKKSKIVVAINAINSINYIGGTRGARKGKVIPKELLQICIGHHCLIIKLEPDAVGTSTSLKAFFREFFQDARFMFVGIGIKEIADELHRDFKDTHLKDLAFIPKPVDLRELAACDAPDFLKKKLLRKKCSLKKLVKYFLGINYEKPNALYWYGRDNVKWSSVDVYIMALIGRMFSN